MRSTSPSKEFITIRDIYKDVNGKPKLVKKDVQTKIRIYLDEVYMVEEVLSSTGKGLKGMCGINLRDKGFVIIKDKFESVVTAVFGDCGKENKKIGFNV